MSVKQYAQYISEQAKSHGKFHNGPVRTISESEDTHHGRKQDVHQDKAYAHVQSAIKAGKAAGMKINHTTYTGESGKAKTTALSGGPAHSKPHMTVHSGDDDKHYGYTVHSGAPKVKGVGDAHKVSSGELHGD
jgi:hypothetical protein